MFERYYNAINLMDEFQNSAAKKQAGAQSAPPETYIKRMGHLLRLLGNPERKFKFIHIAGTAGKGTVVNMAHEILAAAGKRVGSFTSPHATTAIERIKVNSQFIAPEEFAEIFERVKTLTNFQIKGEILSFFEILLAIALLYFQKQKCEWVLLETGIGGRYDATNAIPAPKITAITNIDYDHTELLGKTLEKIAYDKAGIIKPGTVFFTAEQRPKLIKIFKQICDEKGAGLRQIPRQKNYNGYNCALAKAIAEQTGITDENAVSGGIQRAFLPCRFETAQNNPKVILDGAHNRIKIKTVVSNLKNLAFRKLFLIIGIMEGKDSRAVLEQIVPLADYVFLTGFQSPRKKSIPPEKLLKITGNILKADSAAVIFQNSKDALSAALREAAKDDLILITGSFVLAGKLREHWFSEESILKHRRL